MDLKPFNTFGISASCNNLEVIEVHDDFNKITEASNNQTKFLILGGGSNVLFTDQFNGTVFLIRTSGIEILEENDEHVTMSVAAGEDWHQFVSACLGKNYFGLENLALIPGTVGAAPIQNIGAYGAEVKERIIWVNAINLKSGEEVKFNTKDCNFAYRDSYFKQQIDRWCVTHVAFKLDKKYKPVISYEPLSSLYSNLDRKITAKEVFDKVVEIRRAKLPDPQLLGNAGSFFKNPVVKNELFTKLKYKYPDLPFYKVDDSNSKLPAGWLIDKLGLKGHSNGGASIHTQQALVIVNQNNATGKDVLALAKEIEEAVFNEFKVKLEREVRVIG